MLVVGDLKTPHRDYIKMQNKSNIIYLSPKYQEKKYPEISKLIGWRTIQRRNIGFIDAYRRGAEIIATVDDDNIPYESWGSNLLVGKKEMIDVYRPTKVPIFDPLSITDHNDIWHRGYPLEYLKEKNDVEYMGKFPRKILVQADLWDGDPDIDAMARLTKKPIVKFNSVKAAFASNQISPFNSQNTFIHRSVLRDYAVWPFVGRMDDIWAGYYYQSIHPNTIVYNKASVYQNRNAQDLITNLEKEIIGYRNTLNFINNLGKMDVLKNPIVPDNTKKFIKTYKKYFE